MLTSRSLPYGSPAAALAGIALLLAAAPAGAAAGAPAYDPAYEEQAGYDSGYSYVRNLRGSATLVQGDSGEDEAAELNQPVLVGDRLWVSPGSFAEVLLSDGNLLRLDGDSEVLFARLAASPESRDEVTEVVLVAGNVQLVVFADASGSELPRVELPNATVHVEEPGSYRLTAGSGWSRVLARNGWAEVVTDGGSVVVRSGEEAHLEGDDRPYAQVRSASGRDSLERWGDRLDEQVARNDYLDPSLRYQAASMEDHGTWVTVDQRRAWRPYAAADWRPYYHGRWEYTPLGVTWVSSEPWGWVPYHYGTWDHTPGHGWVWFPGSAFAPAWVYWYWGPSEVAWVPLGYYTRHYWPRYHDRWGFRFGVYGWAGGHSGVFNDWVFCSTGHFGSRFGSRHHWSGRDWQRHHGDRAVPRGIIAVDTRGVTPDRWNDGEAAMRALRSRPVATGGARGSELTDVTAFVARRGELPDDVARQVFVDRDDAARVRVAGTPLQPDQQQAVRRRAVTSRPDTAGSVGTVTPGVRTRRVVASPDAGSRGGSEVPRASVRPRGVETQPPDRGAGSGSAGVVRPRRVVPSTPASTPGGGVRVAPRRDEPQGSPGAGAGTVRPRRVVPRAPAGDPGRPAATAVQPRSAVRPDADRGPTRRVTPESYRSSPRTFERPTSREGSTGRPTATRVAPRSERGGIAPAPPARRVVRGIRAEPSGGSRTPAAAAPRSAPTVRRAAPSGGGSGSAARSSATAGSRRGGSDRPAASSQSKSQSRSRSSTSSRSSGSSGSSGRGRATRRGGGGGG